MTQIPVTITLLLIFVIVHFASAQSSSLDLTPTIKNTFFSNFFHADFDHLIKNAFSLYAMSRLEVELGSQLFLSLISVSLVLNTLVESLVCSYMEIPCSIGFSGVLFSLGAWDIFKTESPDPIMAVALFWNFIFPIIRKNKNVSILGHFIGIISGVFSAGLWSLLRQKE